MPVRTISRQPFSARRAASSINILRLTASHPPADIGDQAVAAELIAPVLNLKKGPRMAGAPTDMKTLIAPRGIDIQRSVRMRLDQLRQTALLIVSDHQIHRCVRLRARLVRLYVAADRYNQRIRILLSGPVKHLARICGPQCL